MLWLPSVVALRLIPCPSRSTLSHVYRSAALASMKDAQKERDGAVSFVSAARMLWVAGDPWSIAGLMIQGGQWDWQNCVPSSFPPGILH